MIRGDRDMHIIAAYWLADMEAGPAFGQASRCFERGTLSLAQGDEQARSARRRGATGCGGIGRRLLKPPREGSFKALFRIERALPAHIDRRMRPREIAPELGRTRFICLAFSEIDLDRLAAH